MDAGKLAESETAYAVISMAIPILADAHFLLGYVLFREKKARNHCLNTRLVRNSVGRGAEELKIVASDYVLLNDFVDADKWFTEVVTEAPNDANAHYLLGRTKFNENDYRGAIASFERALALRPKNVEAENNIGLAWRELNDTRIRPRRI